MFLKKVLLVKCAEFNKDWWNQCIISKLTEFFIGCIFILFAFQDLFVLLDLLGGADPLIVNHFRNTERWFDRLVAAGEQQMSPHLRVKKCLCPNSALLSWHTEKRLHRQGLLTSHPSEQAYFRKDFYLGPVQDDHIPFLHKGECRVQTEPEFICGISFKKYIFLHSSSLFFTPAKAFLCYTSSAPPSQSSGTHSMTRRRTCIAPPCWTWPKSWPCLWQNIWACEPSTSCVFWAASTIWNHVDSSGLFGEWTDSILPKTVNGWSLSYTKTQVKSLNVGFNNPFGDHHSQGGRVKTRIMYLCMCANSCGKQELTARAFIYDVTPVNMMERPKKRRFSLLAAVNDIQTDSNHLLQLL